MTQRVSEPWGSEPRVAVERAPGRLKLRASAVTPESASPEADAALAAVVRPGDVIFVGTGVGEPTVAIDALIRLSAEVAPIHVIQVMTGGQEALADASGGRLRLHCLAPGRRSRRALAEGRADPLLCSMAQLQRLISDSALRIDGAFLQAGPTTDGDHASPGLSVDLGPIAFERARYRIVELNSKLPSLDCEVALDLRKCDCLIAVEREPIDLPPPSPSRESAAIGEQIAELLSDGDTVEIGVGKALGGLASALSGRRRQLAVHTGLVSDWLVNLVEAGTVERPLACTGTATVATVVSGSRSFHGWLERTHALRLADSRHVHDVAHLASLGNFVAINSAAEVDLLGQVNSVRLGGEIIGSTGGLLDFACAGVYQRGSIIALEASRINGTSTIVPSVQHVTLPASLVSHVVTEFGTASLIGASARERALGLINVAHPQHREALLLEARRAGLT